MLAVSKLVWKKWLHPPLNAIILFREMQISPEVSLKKLFWILPFPSPFPMNRSMETRLLMLLISDLSLLTIEQCRWHKSRNPPSPRNCSEKECFAMSLPCLLRVLSLFFKEWYPFTGILPGETNSRRVNTTIPPVSLYTWYTNTSQEDNARPVFTQLGQQWFEWKTAWLKVTIYAVYGCTLHSGSLLLLKWVNIQYLHQALWSMVLWLLLLFVRNSS